MFNVKTLFRPRGINPFQRFTPRVNPIPIRCHSTYRRFNNQVTTTHLLYNPQFRKYAGGFLLLTGIFYVSNLEAAPVTGRRRFIWTTEGLERRIGDYSYKQVLADNRGKILPDNHPVSKKVTNIFKKILDVSPIDESTLDWKVHIVNDPQAPPNAFVIPGGKVFVFSSILGICANDDGIATVLSHEFSHQLARHTGENLSKTPIYALMGLIMYSITGADIFNSLLINAVFKMPASREMETEADYIGLMLMSEACFDPKEAPKLWERMANWEKRSGLSQFEFMSTHPGTDRRASNMQKWLPEAENKREHAHCNDFISFYDFGRGRELF